MLIITKLIYNTPLLKILKLGLSKTKIYSSINSLINNILNLKF